MGKIHGRNAKLFIDDSSGACQDLSADGNSITLNLTQANFDATTFADLGRQRVEGLTDATLDFSGIFNSGASRAVSVFSEMYGASDYRRVQFTPASTTGCPIFTGCFLLSAFNNNAPLEGVTTISATFEQASASLTAACIS